MGLGDAGAVFQTAVDRILSGLPGVFAYSDNILVDDSRLNQVLQRLSDNNCHLKASKLVIRTNSIPMLGRIIEAKPSQPTSIKPDPKNVQSILRMPTLKTKHQWEQFIGAVGFLKDFVPNLTELMTLLRHANLAATFKWTSDCELCFQKVKALLCWP